MPKVNMASIIEGASKALEAVNALAPVAEKLGVPSIVANSATIAIAAMAVVENVLERSADLKLAMTSQDEAKLKAMLAELQAVNDRLAGTISAG